jgi:hypothetical protein
MPKSSSLIAAPGQEHIARLDVAVYQLVLVPRILQRLAHRRQQLDHRVQRQRALLGQIGIQILPSRYSMMMK